METLFWIALAIVALIGLYFLFRLIIGWVFKPMFIAVQTWRIHHLQDQLIEARISGELSREEDQEMQNRIQYLMEELKQLNKF